MTKTNPHCDFCTEMLKHCKDENVSNFQWWVQYKLSWCDNTLPKPLLAIRSGRLVFSLISDQGYFTFLYGHTKHNIHNREGGRKENKHWHWLALSARRKKFVTLLCSSLCICRLLRAHIRAKFPQSHKRILTHLLTLANPGSQSTSSSSCLSQPSASPDFFRLVCSLLWSLLSASLVWLFLCSPWDLPSLILFQSRGRSRMQALCVGFAPKQTKVSSTPVEMNATHRVTMINLVFFTKKCDLNINISNSSF